MNRSEEVIKEYNLPVMKDPVIIPDVKKPEPPKPVEKVKPQPKLATKKFSSVIKPVPDQLVHVDPPTIKDLDHVQIGSVDAEGDKSNAISEIPAKDESGAAGSGTDPNAVRTVGNVDKMPEFAGGFEAWAKFLRKNLRYPSSAVDNQVTGRVVVSFVVERDGSISDVKVVKGIGYGCDEEALRVIKKAPAWSPGIQAGQPVRVQYTIPIAFQLN
ncbi:MAG: energy transducer TonB [Mucilaginibacter polytrichastri]|nr:energy transducer TonB [Mucilaginibacter polytrichastri]